MSATHAAAGFDAAGLTHPQQNLLCALEGLVPMFVLEMRDWTFEERRDSLDVEAVTCTADVLMYPSGPKRRKDEREASVRALGALARGLAVGAFSPGGVTFAGLHFCVRPHCSCPDRPRAVCDPVCAGCPDTGGGVPCPT